MSLKPLVAVALLAAVVVGCSSSVEEGTGTDDAALVARQGTDTAVVGEPKPGDPEPGVGDGKEPTSKQPTDPDTIGQRPGAPVPAKVCDTYRVLMFQRNANLNTCRANVENQGDAACRAMNCPSSNRPNYQIGGVGPYTCYGSFPPPMGQAACPAGNNCYGSCNNCANANDCAGIAGTICCPNGTCKPNGQC